ncbi:hypothetical protein OC842_001456 [Tilletia horrida]|uniref:Uncharacterized protein n=1 Tax=Tilletia horrida TaxID=155126 RepID=A0AAN6JM79_9BASI|nr:hypothetical protein OC842_001456 [Tilletia horrida]
MFLSMFSANFIGNDLHKRPAPFWSGQTFLFGLERLVVIVAATLGFIGAAYADRRLITIYSRTLWALFGLYFLLDALNIALFFPSRAELARRCLKHAHQILKRPDDQSQADWDRQLKEGCDLAWEPTLSLLCFGMAIIKLISLWTCMIAHRYRQQLDEKAREEEELGLGSLPPRAAPPRTTNNAQRPLRGAIAPPVMPALPVLPPYSDDEEGGGDGAALAAAAAAAAAAGKSGAVAVKPLIVVYDEDEEEDGGAPAPASSKASKLVDDMA